MRCVRKVNCLSSSLSFRATSPDVVWRIKLGWLDDIRAGIPSQVSRTFSQLRECIYMYSLAWNVCLNIINILMSTIQRRTWQDLHVYIHTSQTPTCRHTCIHTNIPVLIIINTSRFIEFVAFFVRRISSTYRYQRRIELLQTHIYLFIRSWHCVHFILLPDCSCVCSVTENF